MNHFSSRFLRIAVVAVLVVVGCGSAPMVSLRSGGRGITEIPPEPSILSGRYYSGNGRDRNITIRLKADSTYNAVWRGCLGKYGDASGSWELADSMLYLNPDKMEGMMLFSPRVFLIQRYDSLWILIPLAQEYWDVYKKYGVSERSCFYRYSQ